MDDKSLRSVLARSFNRKNFDLVDKFLKHNGSQRLHRHKLSYCSDKATRRVPRGVKAFNLVLEIEHLLLEFFLLDLVFVRQSHIPFEKTTSTEAILNERVTTLGNTIALFAPKSCPCLTFKSRYWYSSTPSNSTPEIS